MALIDSCSHTHLMEKVLVVVVIFVIYDATTMNFLVVVVNSPYYIYPNGA